MEKIPSFQVDHTTMHRGIYISRVDMVENTEVTTYDIRVKVPNVEPAMTSEIMHTIEHFGATFLRNSEVRDDVIYFGGMGCLTGFYMILKGEHSPEEVWELTRDLFLNVSSSMFDDDVMYDIPGITEKECGNYKLHDQAGAVYCARKFLREVLLRFVNMDLHYGVKQHA